MAQGHALAVTHTHTQGPTMAMVWPGEALAAPMRPASEGRDQRRRGSGGGGGGRERRAGQRADWRAAAARRTGAGAGVGGITTGRLVAAAGEGEANARMGDCRSAAMVANAACDHLRRRG